MRKAHREGDYVKTEAGQGHKATNREMPRSRSWKRQRKEVGPTETMVLDFYVHYSGIKCSIAVSH